MTRSEERATAWVCIEERAALWADFTMYRSSITPTVTARSMLDAFRVRRAGESDLNSWQPLVRFAQKFMNVYHLTREQYDALSDETRDALATEYLRINEQKFKANTTATGRWAASAPNIQNIPRRR